ncbi:glutamate decarboxylase 1-like [Gordionus sp. m RMFG-2023]|uniref:glutamate decarboxylase 1-like n=1 Tax=Gordionus sp. m RMFG-2023 TaxID=3053472 RepID=UPI0031FDC015
MKQESLKVLNNSFYTDLLPYNSDGPNGHSSNITKLFLKQIFDLVINYINYENNRDSKVLDFTKPEDLMKMIDFNIPDGSTNYEDTSKKGNKNSKSLSDVIDLCNLVLKYQVKTGHPRFYNQLTSGLDILSLAGEILTAVTNSNMFTYEISPVYILMEQFVIDKMCELIGFHNADGIFSPGGTISNLYGVLCARYWSNPTAKQKGNISLDKPLIIFTSQHCHYSIKSAAAVSGIGTDNVMHIECDEKGHMLIKNLEQKIIEHLEKGNRPLMVNATSGTTVYGSFDLLEPIGDICRKYGLWFHVDASWGGGALLSRKHRNLLKGIEMADSVTWNPHKLMGALLQCSAFLTKHKGLLQECNQMGATYLYQKDKPYDINYDIGDKSIQCGRHVDVLKLWIMWQAKGTFGIEKQVDYLWDMSKFFVDAIKDREGFELILKEPECTNVCFWYLPPSIRDMKESEEKYALLGKVAPIIKRKMMESGTMMISYQPLLDKVNFFRMVITNPAVVKEDLIFVVEEVERLGRNITF